MMANPPALAGRLFPSRSTTSASMPRNGLVAEPGFKGTVGKGVMRMDPVSVCHQVSMIGLSLPVTRWNLAQHPRRIHRRHRDAGDPGDRGAPRDGGAEPTCGT